jgi:hypothetical protein
VSETPAAEQWVEIYRGLRRSAQVVMRYLRDGGLTPRDARHLPGVKAKPNEFVVQVPASQAELAGLTMAKMKKSFPDVFVVGKVHRD